jgi:TonB family protein
VLRLAVVLLLLAVPAGAAAVRQALTDSLAAARDLYTTADYREALAMLTRLRPSATTPEDVRAIDQYRAYALFALGQTAEAELVIEGIAGIDPTWTLPAGEAPPRLTALFAQARERALPGVLRQRIAAARALYSEKRYDASAEAFTGILLLLDDPALAKAAGADLQSMTALATGFRDLSLAADEQARAAAARQAAAAAPPSAAASVAAAPPSAAASVAAATPAAPDGAAGAPPPTAPASDSTAAPAPSEAPAASGGSDKPATEAAAPPAAPNPADIVPPVAIAQALPRATDITVPLGGPQTILLDIVIDEAGRVERAEVRRSVNRLYEAQLVAATRGWRYTPATQAGRPVKYARTLEVTLNPRD